MHSKICANQYFAITLHSQTSNNGAIAQLVEQRTENPCVTGSIPVGTTIHFRFNSEVDFLLGVISLLVVARPYGLGSLVESDKDTELIKSKMGECTFFEGFIKRVHRNAHFTPSQNQLMGFIIFSQTQLKNNYGETKIHCSGRCAGFAHLGKQDPILQKSHASAQREAQP